MLWRKVIARHSASISAFEVIVIVFITIAGTLFTTCVFQELVQLAAVKPNAPASWAVIDLHASSFTHPKLDITGRAFHR